VYRNGSSTRDRQNLQGQGASVHADWRVADSATLTSISAYERADTIIFENFSGRDVPHYYDIRHHDIVDQFSQELRLSGTADRLYWVGGLYYFRENIDSHLTSYFQSSSIGLGPGGAIPYALPEQYRTLMDTNSLTHSAAGFGQVEYDLTGRVKLIGGLRFTYEEKDYLRAVSYNIPRVPSVDNLVSVGRINPTNGRPSLRYLRADSTVPLHADWHNLSWKMGVNYQLVPSSMLYGTVSTGFKAGTYSGSTLILPEALARPANPERLTATEVGIKSTLLNGHLRLNAAAFHYDYRDLQITSTIHTSTGDNSSILDNVGKATVNGIDLDAAWQPFGGLTLGLALGYLNGIYKDFISDGRDFSGLHLINAPDLTATGRATYQWRTGVGAFTLSSDVAYTSKTDLDFRDDPNSTVDFDRARSQFVAAAHTLIDARTAWRNVAGNLEVSLWGQNLTNKAVLTHSTFGVNEAVLFYGPPRSFGFNVSLSF
jgi:iron complex outermembrane receptor protein